jgi:hypothetical protein
MLTIREIPAGLINTAKRLTGRGTGSQAFIAAVQLADSQADDLSKMREELSAYREQVRVYQQVLSRARDAAVQLAEIAAQGDMFVPPSENPLRPGCRR